LLGQKAAATNPDEAGGGRPAVSDYQDPGPETQSPHNAAPGCSAHGLPSQSTTAIKKSVENSQPFHLAINFNRAPLEALSLQEFREVFLGHGNRPAEVGKRDSLGSATLTDLKLTLLDIVPRLGEQPVAQVPEVSSIRRRNSSTGTFRISKVSGEAPSFATNSTASWLE
jgi:hypothetical protein